MNVCVAHLQMNTCVAKNFGAWTEKVGHPCPTFMAHPTRVGRRVGALHKKLGHPCFIVYMTASPAETPSVTSGLGVSVQPAKPASPIRFLYEELPKVYVFSEHKLFTTCCTPFPHRISHFKILVMP